MPFLDLANRKNYVSEAIQAQRKAICATCPHIRAVGLQCGLCLCLVNLKTKLKTEQCPDKPPRWEKQA